MSEPLIERLIFLLAKLPGLGPRSARRIALYLMRYKEGLMIPLADAMFATASAVMNCKQCGNLDTAELCSICRDCKRDLSTICVVESVADLWAIERGKIYKGLYHVLGGTLSAYDSRGPNDLNLEQLDHRIEVSQFPLVEIILATNATVDGQTTAHYITERFKDKGIKFSRLGVGIPVGGELDYLDEGTLSAALKMRHPF